MKSVSNYSVRTLNTFSVEANCPEIYYPASVDELKVLSQQLSKPFYVLGEGSNTLFVDSQTPVLIKPNLTGIEISEDDEHYYVSAAASENWHQLVCHCVDNGINGLENLALIPGSVGAAPVQNIGAYGTELSDYCCSVNWFEFSSGTLQSLSASQCQFSYRNSIFKQALKNSGIITKVTLCLPKKWQPNLSYHGLNQLSTDVTAKHVMKEVMKLRRSKLPDPDQIPNAGSFFKNPIVSQAQFEKLKEDFNDIPYYLQNDRKVKLAAGWLIEQAGLKGYRTQGVGVHDKQALVLVNYNSKHGRDIINLAKYIQACVYEKFGVSLQPEVRMVTQLGESTWDAIVNHG